MSGMDRLTELLDSLKAQQAPFTEGGPRHPSKKNAYFRALAEAYESGDLVVAHRRASQAAPAPSDALREAFDRLRIDEDTPIDKDPGFNAGLEAARAALSTPTEGAPIPADRAAQTGGGSPE